MQEAAKIKALAEAEAEKEARVGIGKAIAIEQQVKAYGGPQFQVTQDIMSKFTEAMQEAGIPIVPQTVISMGDGKGSAANAFELLLSLIIGDKLGAKVGPPGAEDERVKKVKDAILLALEMSEKQKEREIKEAAKGKEEAAAGKEEAKPKK